MTREEIRGTVRDCVAESLALSAEEIRGDSRLIDDLGADSLDFLDILFSLERAFSTKLRDPNLDLLVRADFTGEKSLRDGKISAETLERLREWLPNLSHDSDITIRNLYSCITIETLAYWVEKKLPEK